MKKIALLTSAKHARLISDDLGLVSAATKAGLTFQPAIWDQAQDWSNFHAVIIRTPWDYFERKDEFLAVLQTIKAGGAKLFNPLETVQWNLDKKYLFELQRLGLPVPRTVLLKQETPAAGLSGLSEVVVKPLVSAGGFETHHLKAADYQSFNWQRLPWDGFEFMAQEFLPAILTEGEYSFVFFDGEFSHALRKTPKQGECRVQDDHGGSVHAYAASAQDIAEASAIVRRLPIDHLYCRVDLARHPNGKLMIMEIELIEPELFFRFSQKGEERFVQALMKYL